MDFYINCVNGKEYLYARDTIQIKKGLINTKTTSIGPLDDDSAHFIKKINFLNGLINKETLLRQEYWQQQSSKDLYLKYVNISKIEALRTKYTKIKDYLGDNITGYLDNLHLADFIYNSNRIEGSKLPKNTVQQMVLEGFQSKEPEVANTLRAMGFIDNGFRFNLRSIKKLHSVLLEHLPHIHGYRTDPVVVGNYQTTAPKDIESKLVDLLEWYKKNKKDIYPPKLAFEFYYRFERIHPFLDGNGRVGRLLLNKILDYHNYPKLIIWDENAQGHFTAFKNHINNMPAKYHKFMANQLIKTYQTYLNLIAEQFPAFQEHLA